MEFGGTGLEKTGDQRRKGGGCVRRKSADPAGEKL